MPLRLLLRYLANEQVIDKLANTYVIRRVAQLTHYGYRSLTAWGNETLEKLAESDAAKQTPQTTGRLASFMKTFMENLDEEVKQSQLKGKHRPKQ